MRSFLRRMGGTGAAIISVVALFGPTVHVDYVTEDGCDPVDARWSSTDVLREPIDAALLTPGSGSYAIDRRIARDDERVSPFAHRVDRRKRG